MNWQTMVKPGLGLDAISSDKGPASSKYCADVILNAFEVGLIPPTALNAGGGHW